MLFGTRRRPSCAIEIIIRRKKLFYYFFQSHVHETSLFGPLSSDIKSFPFLLEISQSRMDQQTNIWRIVLWAESCFTPPACIWLRGAKLLNTNTSKRKKKKTILFRYLCLCLLNHFLLKWRYFNCVAGSLIQSMKLYKSLTIVTILWLLWL